MAMRGLWRDQARVLAAVTPINREPIRPGRWVMLMASIWSRVRLAWWSDSRRTGRMFWMWAREAISGTTPRYLAWMAAWEATMLLRTVRPSRTMAAAVSSQVDSIPSTVA